MSKGVKPFFVYMLRCADRSYYVGHTDDLERRIAQHHAGEIDGYTQQRRPVELVWSQEAATRDEALLAERRIKGWARARKEALINGDWSAIQRQARGIRNPLPERLQSGDPAQGASIPQPERDRMDGEGLASRILAAPGPVQRRAIAKAITLLESTRTDHRERADVLLNALLSSSGRSFRLGISGVPGVGKSTFIEVLGLRLIERGHRVAVLAVDPSSTLSGGSILGDKTRMERLSVDERAFIRPSPTAGTLGGVAEKTREAMLVLEAAGHDIVIVETVGVGQSETAVAGMTDMFVLLQLPNAGDDLQAIKKGVMELADLVAINKSDLDAEAATRAQAQIASALKLHAQPTEGWQPQVLQLSALKNCGLDEFWSAVERFQASQRANGHFERRRQQQSRAWMIERIEAGLKARFRSHPKVKQALGELTAAVDAGRVTASVAARRLLDLMD